jgi:hypothetical protein
MGTKMAPSYANIFMGRLETQFLSGRELQPLLYVRFIDDIFMIWHHGQDSLHTFIEDFNQVHPSIKFTHSIASDKIPFLDVSVIISGTQLSTTLYKKPTDNPSYLHYYSEHPKFMKHSIPYSLAIRCRRLCSDIGDTKNNLQTLKDKFVSMSYPRKIVDDAIDKALQKPRDELHEDQPADYRQTEHTEHNKTRLITTYHHNNPPLNRILQRHYNILCQSTRLATLFPSPPQVVYRRPQNLRDRLIHAKVNVPQQTYHGSGPCGKPCHVCPLMRPVNRVKSSKSDFVFDIRGNYTCSSKNVVYLLECGLCRMQYIGETTQEFRNRVSGHKSDYYCDIKARDTGGSSKGNPIARHYFETGHQWEDITAHILKGSFKTDLDRKCLESRLIHGFDSYRQGLNQNPGLFPTY